MKHANKFTKKKTWFDLNASKIHPNRDWEIFNFKSWFFLHKYRERILLSLCSNMTKCEGKMKRRINKDTTRKTFLNYIKSSQAMSYEPCYSTSLSSLWFVSFLFSCVWTFHFTKRGSCHLDFNALQDALKSRQKKPTKVIRRRMRMSRKRVFFKWAKWIT